MQILQEKDCVSWFSRRSPSRWIPRACISSSEGERLLICAEGEAKHVDGRSITTRQAAFQAFQPVEGGVDAAYQADNGLVLTMRFTAVDPGRAFRCRPSCPTPGRGRGEPLPGSRGGHPRGQEQPHYMKSHLLSLLRVPYDNDMWDPLRGGAPSSPAGAAMMTAMFQ